MWCSKMSKLSQPENPVLRRLIKKLRKVDKSSESKIWGDLAERLSRSNRKRTEVNISQINRHTNEGDVVVVPGKVLGSGRLNHSLSIAAFEFSSRARKVVLDERGEVLTIDELLEKNPKGEGIIIIE